MLKLNIFRLNTAQENSPPMGVHKNFLYLPQVTSRPSDRPLDKIKVYNLNKNQSKYEQLANASGTGSFEVCQLFTLQP